MIRFTTNLGSFDLELDAKAAPKTVANFERYVKEGLDNGTLLHRVIDGFMIQGGGFEAGPFTLMVTSIGRWVTHSRLLGF